MSRAHDNFVAQQEADYQWMRSGPFRFDRHGRPFPDFSAIEVVCTNPDCPYEGREHVPSAKPGFCRCVPKVSS